MFLKIDQEWLVVPNVLLKLERTQNFTWGLYKLLVQVLETLMVQ